MVRNMDFSLFTQEKHRLFFMQSLNRSTFPTFRGIWHTIPRTSSSYKRSQRLFLKRSLRHVENICIAQHGLKSEPEASISPPCKFFKANKLKCGPEDVQFLLFTLSSWIQTHLHILQGEKWNKCQIQGCCDKFVFL